MTGRLVAGEIEQPETAAVPVLIIVAKAVTVPPTWAERLSGSTAATRPAEVLALELEVEVVLELEVEVLLELDVEVPLELDVEVVLELEVVDVVLELEVMPNPAWM